MLVPFCRQPCMPLQGASTTILPSRHNSSAVPSSVHEALPSFSGVHALPAAATARSHLAPWALATQPSFPVQSSSFTQWLFSHLIIAFLSAVHCGSPSVKQASPTAYWVWVQLALPATAMHPVAPSQASASYLPSTQKPPVLSSMHWISPVFSQGSPALTVLLQASEPRQRSARARRGRWAI